MTNWMLLFEISVVLLCFDLVVSIWLNAAQLYGDQTVKYT